MARAFVHSLPCLALLAALGAAPAYAAPRGASAATLAAPTGPSTPTLIDGRFWRCDALSCTAAPSPTADSQPAPRECARATSRLGTFTAYEGGPRVLTAEELASCNASAPKPRGS